MGSRLKPIAIGLALSAGLWFFGIAWPLSEGYPSLLHWLGDRIIADKEPRFDRAGLSRDIAAAGYALGDDAHVRIYKREHRLELWMRPPQGRYGLFRSYAICKYSGGIGPKLAEGDRQSPEGFYRVAKAQLNPGSRHHLAFNLGFPNAFDRQLGRTGSFLMVHGGCTSIGCYAMTDEKVDEIYAIVEAALNRGQDEVDVSIFPFVMSDAAVEATAGDEWHPYWRNLKQGFDLFLQTGLPPSVAACRGEYRFGADATGPGCEAIRGWV